MQIIVEYEVEESTLAILTKTRIYGPYKDAISYLKKMGAVEGTCAGYVAFRGDRPGDWGFLAFAAGDKTGESGPWVIKPDGWDDSGEKDNDHYGLTLRIFSVQDIHQDLL